MKVATICYVQSEGKTLLICCKGKKDDRFNNKYNGLGGKLLKGETPEEGAIREVLEESGLRVEHPRLAGYILFPHMGENDDLLCFVYVFEGYSGTLKESSEGTLQWVETAKILEMPTWESDKHMLAWVLQKRLFSARFIYEGDTIKDWNVVFFD